MRLLIVGGSDAGTSAALRARELDQNSEITVLLADDFPNYSICGLPFDLTGETADWRTLAHRTEFDGISICRGHKEPASMYPRKRFWLRMVMERLLPMHTRNS